MTESIQVFFRISTMACSQLISLFPLIFISVVLAASDIPKACCEKPASSVVCPTNDGYRILSGSELETLLVRLKKAQNKEECLGKDNPPMEVLCGFQQNCGGNTYFVCAVILEGPLLAIMAGKIDGDTLTIQKPKCSATKIQQRETFCLRSTETNKKMC